MRLKVMEQRILQNATPVKCIVQTKNGVAGCIKMSKNTKKQTTKYVSRWFTKGWLEDDDFLSDLKSFPSREEAYDYTKDMLDAPSNTSMPFAVIWEQKYPLLNLADGVDYGAVLGMLREINEQLNDQLEDYSDARFKRPYKDYKTKEQFDDRLNE